MDKAKRTLYWNIYKKILNRYSPELEKCANSMRKKNQTVLFQTTVCVTAPILFSYVSWVLIDAVERKKERLYFLARDGYVMFRIAKILCKEYQLPIECRYLYASRMAWRLPQYHLIKEKSIETICLNGIEITLDKILERGALTKEEKDQIRIQLKLSLQEMNRVLSRKEITDYKRRLLKHTNLLQYVEIHAKEAYWKTMGYLEQEGLLEGKRFAIVDIGWAGSMQESLKCLLESKKVSTGEMDGYYFGMFGNSNKNQQLDSYHVWYFNRKGQIKRKLFFSHNLFECMCCAKDGMTIGYSYQNETKQYQPILASQQNLNIGKWDVEMQIHTIEKFAEQAVKQILNLKEWEKKTKTKKMVYQLCQHFMTAPTKEQAEYYGKFLFSDDVTEKHVTELAPIMTEEQIRQNSVWNHIKNRVFPKWFSKIEIESCWMEGTLARSECKRKYFRYCNLFLYKFLLFIIIK